jgi:hypothetical protein
MGFVRRQPACVLMADSEPAKAESAGNVPVILVSFRFLALGNHLNLLQI